MMNPPFRTSFLFFLSFALLATAMSLVGGQMVSAQTTLTVKATEQRSIGGISVLDRSKFFTFTESLVPSGNALMLDGSRKNLRREIWAADGLNIASGRVSTELDQFISQNLLEDTNRPGFVDDTTLRNRLQGDYRNFVTTGTRWESLRNTSSNPILVNSGRSSTFFPSYLRAGEQDPLFPNRTAYADFLNTYLDEAVYGTNAFLPIDQDRFHIEILNEPDLHIAGAFGGSNQTLLTSSTELAEYHRDIANAVKAVHPNASIGGPGLAVTSFAENDFRRWENTVKPFIEVAGGSVDFYSLHPYERYDVQNDGSVSRLVDQSPGRVNAQLDLIIIQHEQTHGGRLPIAVTEYASFNRSNTSAGYGNYSRDEQQWDLSRDFREQLLVYINRPDAILNAVPFVQGRHYSSDVPTPESADNVLFEQVASGRWRETIVANTFRAYADVKGEYLGLDGGNGDLQSAAFRDGDTVYVLLNNLLSTNQQVDLQVLLDGFGTVASASMDRVFRSTSGNQFLEDVDITNSYQSLTLNAQEGAVITLSLAGSNGITTNIAEDTYFGGLVATELNVTDGKSPTFQIDADTQDAVSAILRVGYSRPGNSPEAFSVFVNGNEVTIPGGDLGIDDGDDGLFSREMEVPIGFLVDGANDIYVDFSGNGGYLSSAALRVLSSFVPGDYNDDGIVDAADFTVWRDNQGTTNLLPNDLIGGSIGSGHYEQWATHFGDSLASTVLTSVPEPAVSSWMVAVMLASLIGATRKRRV